MNERIQRNRDHVASLERGLAVLETLCAHPRGLTLSETAALTGLTRAGARRLLLTLKAIGYVSADRRSFVPSPKIVALANRVSRDLPFRAIAETAMARVSAVLGESCSAAVLDGNDIVYVARVAGERILTVALDVGSRLPAWCTAMGRVLLAGLPDAELDRRIAATRPVRLTPSTLTDHRQIHAAIVKARTEGFAISDEELEQGLRSIAVPVRNADGEVFAAINVATVPARFPVEEMVSRILPLLLQAAAEIERQTGGGNRR